MLESWPIIPPGVLINASREADSPPVRMPFFSFVSVNSVSLIWFLFLKSIFDEHDLHRLLHGFPNRQETIRWLAYPGHYGRSFGDGYLQPIYRIGKSDVFTLLFKTVRPIS
jgi:hypothetical protein